jgi:L-cysteine:1D-myo-inositol 2-amino-2-deoxy-alpha-D-glucopyranoside ligase
VKLFDRATGTPREVELRSQLGVYVCGITPYDAAHLGHAFTYSQFDVLVRYLRYLGAQVTHVQNVTDVDDDILRVARERGVEFRELAERETAVFEKQMRAIGIAPPTLSPRATEFVPQMIEEVRALVEAGHGYEGDGTVYFRVASDPEYGRLSGYSRDVMLDLAEERGGHPEDPNKDDPLDFVLWQASRPGEPWWESPWGRGRPGWHIECSTMATRLIGQPVDIHGGGEDLIYPHHESELAQAEGVPGERPFVRHWVHTGTVYQAGEKMSKSLGNMTFVNDLLEDHEPGNIRRHLLRRHYRQDWEFDPDRLKAEGAGAVEREPTWADDVEPSIEAFRRAMDADLDTPNALVLLDRARIAGKDWVPQGASILGLPTG